MTRQLYFVSHAFNLRVHAFVLMNNHFHLIVRTPDGNLSDAMRYFMRETSREITFVSGRINQTYGSRFHRSLLHSPLYYLHAYKYLYRNPVEAGLCELVEEYKFSSLQGLLGETWLDVPVREDDNWGCLATREEISSMAQYGSYKRTLVSSSKGLKKNPHSNSPEKKGKLHRSRITLCSAKRSRHLLSGQTFLLSGPLS